MPKWPKCGRPSLVDDTPEMKARREKLLSYLRNGVSTNAAVRAAGIGRSTFMRAMQQGRKKGKTAAPFRDFRDQVQEAIAAAQVGLELRMRKHAETSWGATLAVLRARYPGTWNPEVVAKVMLGLQDPEDSDRDRPLPTITVRREPAPPAAEGAAS